jgi:hypothetical protein
MFAFWNVTKDGWNSSDFEDNDIGIARESFAQYVSIRSKQATACQIAGMT